MQLPLNSFEDSKTAWGKGRAWLRISLMEKRLAEYFAYVNHRENMKRSWYEPWALMRSEEASVGFGGRGLVQGIGNCPARQLLPLMFIHRIR